MAAPAERMKAMRARHQAGALREVQMLLPDARIRSVRACRRAVAHLDPGAEVDALDWLESVAEFDEPDVGNGNAPASR